MTFLDLIFAPPPTPSLLLVATAVLVLCSVAAVAVVVSEKHTKAIQTELRKRVISACVLSPIVILPAYAGGVAFAVLVAVAAELCLREFFKLVHVEEPRAYGWIGSIASAGLIAAAFLESTPPMFWIGMIIGPVEQGQTAYMVSIAHSFHPFYVLPVLIIISVLLVPIAMQNYQGMSVRESFTIFGILYFAWFLGHLVLIRNQPHGFGNVMLLCMCVVFNDVFAYTFGRLWGKEKIAPTISPRKSREGVVAGLVGSIVAALLFRTLVPETPLFVLLGAAVLIGVAAPLGDLIVSVVKRDMGVKDSGTLIPGRGGMLDRCDSFTFAAPVFYYYMVLVQFAFALYKA